MKTPDSNKLFLRHKDFKLADRELSLMLIVGKLKLRRLSDQHQPAQFQLSFRHGRAGTTNCASWFCFC